MKRTPRHARPNRTTETYHVLSANEGGPGRDGAASAAREANVDFIVLGTSPLIGHIAATITGTPTAHRKFCKLVF